MNCQIGKPSLVDYQCLGLAYSWPYSAAHPSLSSPCRHSSLTPVAFHTYMDEPLH